MTDEKVLFEKYNQKLRLVRKVFRTNYMVTSIIVPKWLAVRVIIVIEGGGASKTFMVEKSKSITK